MGTFERAGWGGGAERTDATAEREEIGSGGGRSAGSGQTDTAGCRTSSAQEKYRQVMPAPGVEWMRHSSQHADDDGSGLLAEPDC